MFDFIPRALDGLDLGLEGVHEASIGGGTLWECTNRGEDGSLDGAEVWPLRVSTTLA